MMESGIGYLAVVKIHSYSSRKSRKDGGDEVSGCTVNVEGETRVK